jgi:hypothetical protein
LIEPLGGGRVVLPLADTIYWINFGGDSIRGAALSGGGSVDTLYDSGDGVSIGLGVALDPTAGRIYWANYGDSTIRGAPLAGSGTVDTLYDSGDGVDAPTSVAVDPAAGRVYWSDGGDVGNIKRAPLTGSGPVQTLYDAAQGVFYPTSVVIDPAGQRVYWSDGLFDGKIKRAPIAGGGPVDILYGAAQGVTGPSSVVVDPAAGRVYWLNYPDRSIRAAPLSVGGSIDTLYGSGQGVWNPGRIVIDPSPTPVPSSTPARATLDRLGVGAVIRRAPGWAEDLYSRLFPTPTAGPAERVYWGNGGATQAAPSPYANMIRSAPLAGGGTADTLYGSGQGVDNPTALAVLRSPVGTAAPTVSWGLILDKQPFGGLQFGGTHSGPLGQRLTCSRGSWAPDLLGAFLYRAPQSFAFQWRLNGNDIQNANQADYTPTSPGSYSCRVTATNRAGSASQTSAPVTTT